MVAFLAVGYLVYRGAVSINLTPFFTWTDALLIFVAAGVMFDVTHILSPDSVVATLLKGCVNFSPQTTWPEGLVWLAYVAIVLPLFLREIRSRKAPKTPRPESEPVSS